MIKNTQTEGCEQHTGKKGRHLGLGWAGAGLSMGYGSAMGSYKRNLLC